MKHRRKEQDQIIEIILDEIVKHGLTKAQILDVLNDKGYGVTADMYSYFHRKAFQFIERQEFPAEHERVYVSDGKHVEKAQAIKKIYREKKSVVVIQKKEEPIWLRDKKVLNFIQDKNENQ